MRYDKPLRDILAANVEQTMGVIEPLLTDIDRAGELIAQCFLRDGKLMTCGCSSGLAISKYLTAMLANGIEYERPSLPAMTLATNVIGAGNNDGKQDVYARQVHALGHSDDVLLLFAANNNAAALAQTIIAAHERSIQVVAITGAEDQDISATLAPEDREIYIATSSKTRIIEAHVLIAHCLCTLIEQSLFGIGESA